MLLMNGGKSVNLKGDPSLVKSSILFSNVNKAIVVEYYALLLNLLGEMFVGVHVVGESSMQRFKTPVELALEQQLSVKQIELPKFNGEDPVG